MQREGATSGETHSPCLCGGTCAPGADTITGNTLYKGDAWPSFWNRTGTCSGKMFKEFDNL